VAGILWEDAMGNTSGAIVAAALAVAMLPAQAASHSDAPLIKQDPQADLTDVYAFVGTRVDDNARRVLNVVVQVRPFSDPGDGPTFDRFADDAVYSIHLTHPRSGATVQRYDFRFSDVNPRAAPGLKNGGTILSYGHGSGIGAIVDVGDAQQNYVQSYSVTRVVAGVATVLGSGLPTAPPNVGLRTTPHYNDATGRAVSGAVTLAGLDRYTRQTIHLLASGEVVFAGPREDGYYADSAALSDLLVLRDPGVDSHAGFNVLSFALQVPIEALLPSAYVAPFHGPTQGVGVYASVSRPAMRVLRSTGDPAVSGALMQVNRMGNPLFNQMMVALRDKDAYNRAAPTTDATRLGSQADNPVLAVLLNVLRFGNTAGTSPLATTGRTDLREVFIPDVIRVDTTTGPVRLPGQSGFSRLSFLGADLASNGNSAGWPNGRRPGDDVVDLLMTLVASGPTYSTIVPLGDNVFANDQLYQQVFPYLGTPHAGANHRKNP
jgi:hypothetical protein